MSEQNSEDQRDQQGSVDDNKSEPFRSPELERLQKFVEDEDAYEEMQRVQREERIAAMDAKKNWEDQKFWMFDVLMERTRATRVCYPLALFVLLFFAQLPWGGYEAEEILEWTEWPYSEDCMLDEIYELREAAALVYDLETMSLPYDEKQFLKKKYLFRGRYMLSEEQKMRVQTQVEIEELHRSVQRHLARIRSQRRLSFRSLERPMPIIEIPRDLTSTRESSTEDSEEPIESRRRWRKRKNPRKEDSLPHVAGFSDDSMSVENDTDM